MHRNRFLDLEGAMMRRAESYFDPNLSADELADFAELDAEYEAEMDRLFGEQLAADGIAIETMLAAMKAPRASGNAASMH